MTTLEKLREIVGVGKRNRMDALGGKAIFAAEIRDNSLIIITSSGKEYKVYEDVAEKVEVRFNSLPADKKYKAGHYVRPHWPDCPNNILSPYIARILKERE